MFSARLPLAVLAAVVVRGLSGCAVATESTPVPAPSSVPEVGAGAAELTTAEDVYRSYIDASNAVDLDDPETFALLGEFTSEQFHTEELAALSDMHDMGYVADGAIVIESFRADAPADDQTVVAIACNDVADVTLVDRRGDSLLPDDAPDAYEMRLEFSLIDEELRLSSSVASASRTRC